MLVYIVLLILVIIFSKLIEYKQDKKSGKIIALVLIFILSWIAGVRAINVGWDANKYVRSTFFRLNYFDGDYVKFMASTTVEYGFSLYSYIIFHIYPNIHALLFGYSFLTTLCVFCFAFKEKNNLKLSSVIIIYYLTLYLISYNIIRQSISVSLILLSIPYLKEKKYLKCALLAILASLFHNSGVIFILIYAIYFYLNRKSTINAKMTSVLLLTIALVFITFAYPQIAKALYRLGFLPLKYYNYIVGDNNLDYNLSNIAINSYWVLVGLIVVRNKNEYAEKDKLAFCLMMLNISLLINIASIRTHEIYRIGYYFYYAGLMYFYPSLSNLFSKNKFNRAVIKGITSMLLIVWFLWITILGNGHNIYPYQSDIYTFEIKEES